MYLKDLLPFLPDFTEIDLFKDEICHTLEDCGTRIEYLKAEMSELSISAESITKVEITCCFTLFSHCRNWLRVSNVFVHYGEL